MVTIREQITEATVREVSQSSARFDWIMVLLSTWWVGGAFVDGWAHNHFQLLDTVFTPWHAVLYSGFLVVALFLLVTAVRKHRQGYAWVQALPGGYELSLFGVGIFGIGGVLDLLWHSLFGIEKGMAALLSPTHLMLVLGMVLAVSGPLRAAWQRPAALRRQTLFDLLPAILALAYVLALFTFMTQYVDPILNSQADKSTGSIGRGVVSILFQTVMFMGLALFALRRWQLPAGTFTILYGLNGILMITQGDLSLFPAVGVASFLTGLLLDLLYTVLKPTVDRREALCLFAFFAPIIMQTIYFMLLHATSGVFWVVHLWAGSIVLSGVVGLLLSFLVVPLECARE